MRYYVPWEYTRDDMYIHSPSLPQGVRLWIDPNHNEPKVERVIVGNLISSLTVIERGYPLRVGGSELTFGKWMGITFYINNDGLLDEISLEELLESDLEAALRRHNIQDEWELIKGFINDNSPLLVKHWKGEISKKELEAALK